MSGTYPTPAELIDVVQPVAGHLVVPELARLRAYLAAHMDVCPHWSNLNARAKWALEKDRILGAIDRIEGQINNRWFPVEVPRG
jgi:hypothetical protein